MSKYIETAVRCLQDEAQALLDLIPHLDAEFDKTVEIILNCKGKLIVTGVGKRTYWCEDRGHVVFHRNAFVFH